MEGASCSAPKRQRLGDQSFALLPCLAALPKDLGTTRGDPLNCLLLRFIGGHDVVPCCKATQEWWTLDGRRFMPSLDYICRGPKGPFPVIERIIVSQVDNLRLGRYGQATPEERTSVIAACRNAVAVRCVYSKLAGCGEALAALGDVKLGLKLLRFHQCRLGPADLVQLLSVSRDIESLDCFGEALEGVGPLLAASPLTCPSLRSAEFTDCQLSAGDFAAFLERFAGSLRSLHVQASNLRGARVPELPHLQKLCLLDCMLTREDVGAVLARCPRLEHLELCGNLLEKVAGRDGEARGLSWPKLPCLRRADLRTCGFDSDDEEDLRDCFSCGAGLELRVRADAADAAAAGQGHIVFESSDEE